MPLVGNFREVSSPIYQAVEVGPGPSFPTGRASQALPRHRRFHPHGSLAGNPYLAICHVWVVLRDTSARHLEVAEEVPLRMV